MGYSRKTWGDGFWSLAGTLASVFAGLALVKIAAVWIPSDQYGEASLVLGVVVLLNNLIIGPLMTAHMRIYFDYRTRGLGYEFSSLFAKISLGAAIVCAVFYLMLAIGFWAVGAPYLLRMVWPALLLIMIQPFISLTTNYLEAHRLYFKLAVVNTGQKLLQVPAILGLLLLPISAASAVVLAQTVAILPLLFSSRGIQVRDTNKQGSEQRSLGLRGAYDIFREFSAFGVALPLGYAVNWLLSTSDRYLIGHYMTTQDVGVYAINYGFWSLPFLMLNAWLEILTRPRIYERASRKDWRGMRNILALRMSIALAMGSIGSVILYLIGQKLSVFVLGSNYQTDWGVPISIAVGHFFLILGYAASPAFLATKRVRVVLFATIVAAVLNVSLNLYLIPKHGLMGAAMSTMFAYILWAMIIIASAVRYTTRLCQMSFIVK